MQLKDINEKRVGSVLTQDQELRERLAYERLNKVVVQDKRSKTHMRVWNKQQRNETRDKVEAIETRTDAVKQAARNLAAERRADMADSVDKAARKAVERQKRIAELMSERDQLTEKRSLITGEVIENNMRLGRFKDFRNYKVIEKHSTKSAMMSEMKKQE
jgi:hypothetical protein